MKAKLIKKDGHYFLEVEPNTWTPPNRFHSIIANTLDKKEGDVLQLSLKNCQAIERGYDLDELALNEANKREGFSLLSQELAPFRLGYLKGFKKALELMGDKKFSEEDMKSFAQNYYREIRENTSNLLWNQLADKCLEEHIQSLQENEWDVEIEMRSKDIDELRESNEGFLNNPNLYVPQLDEDDCLILKRV